MQNKLLIATNNPGKAREFFELLAPLEWVELLRPADIGLDILPEEKDSDYRINAEIKARAFQAASGMPCIADDSGLEVDALDGAPGVYSARFGGLGGYSDSARRQYLLESLTGLPGPWTARFICWLAFVDREGRIAVWKGECGGKIVPEERGTDGFGYDSIFEVEGTGRTMAELPPAIKNRLSHRARAVEAALDDLTAYFGLRP
ncbi:MAG: RdgB/HAM1 family non-canonical purine NTP pyrophosphatase [Chloroflexi bacterium]|nr:RdgB/HAM1 family non-canonical purine NTP pyrophosphatase [Chloroflexota bacterium]